jgi:hypothetical protein
MSGSKFSIWLKAVGTDPETAQSLQEEFKRHTETQNVAELIQFFDWSKAYTPDEIESLKDTEDWLK